jgi:hypothetical protein
MERVTSVLEDNDNFTKSKKECFITVIADPAFIVTKPLSLHTLTSSHSKCTYEVKGKGSKLTMFMCKDGNFCKIMTGKLFHPHI